MFTIRDFSLPFSLKNRHALSLEFSLKRNLFAGSCHEDSRSAAFIALTSILLAGRTFLLEFCFWAIHGAVPVILISDCFRLCFKVKECVGGGVLPIMAYTGRLRSKGVSFSGFRNSQTPLIPNTKGAIESVRIKWVGFSENVRTFFP